MRTIRTITPEEVRTMGVGIWEVKDNSPRGCKSISTDDVKKGMKVLIDNYFHEVI